MDSRRGAVARSPAAIPRGPASHNCGERGRGANRLAEGLAIHSASASAISARTSASLRPAARGNVERMIGIVEQPERGARAEPRDECCDQRQVGELVARSLQEQHRDRDVGEMRAAFVRRLARRDAAESRGRRGRARRAAATTPAPATSCGRRRTCRRRRAASSGSRARRRRHRGAHGGCATFGRVRPLRAALHVRKLVAQRGDAALGEIARDVRQERVRHARAGAVRHDVAGARAAASAAGRKRGARRRRRSSPAPVARRIVQAAHQLTVAYAGRRGLVHEVHVDLAPRRWRRACAPIASDRHRSTFSRRSRT